MKKYSIPEYKQSATPSNPGSGFNKLYFKDDDTLYKLTSGGTETAVGGGAAIVGTDWTTKTTPTDGGWSSICYGNNMYVAVASSGAGARCMSSNDTVNWSERGITGNNWHSVCYGNGLFVAVSDSAVGTIDDRVNFSANGRDWTAVAASTNSDWRGVAFGGSNPNGGVYAAVGLAGAVMTTTDGLVWATQTAASANNWVSITFGNNMFVAVSSNGTLDQVMTCSDGGTTWTTSTTPSNQTWTSICYGNGLFVAVASSGTASQRVMTSPDGTTWTLRTAASANDWTSVTYGEGIFVAVASTGTGNRVMTSADGITWTSRTSAADNAWKGICHGNGVFCVVSSDGHPSQVMTSGKTTDTLTALDGRIVASAGVMYGDGTIQTTIPPVTNPLGSELGLGENTSIAFKQSLSGDGIYSGLVENGTAGATLAFGDLCYLQAIDSRWELADANVSDGYDKKLGMCILAAAADGDATKLMLLGKVRADTAFPSLTIGSAVYMGETAGSIVVAKPTTSGACVRIIGFADSDKTLNFNPSNDYTLAV